MVYEERLTEKFCIRPRTHNRKKSSSKAYGNFVTLAPQKFDKPRRSLPRNEGASVNRSVIINYS